MQAIHRVIAGFLVKRAGFKLSRADTGAVTLIQRFGSAANLNIHLHCLVLDGVYLNRDGAAVFHEAAGMFPQILGQRSESLLNAVQTLRFNTN